MLDHQIACQASDGSWYVRRFQCTDDSEAITTGLSVPTTRRGLDQAERWLATFEGATEADDFSRSQTKQNGNRCSAGVESEAAYFHRRAVEERERGRESMSAAASVAHLTMAEHFESLGRVVQAEQRRRKFYDVNASLAETTRSLSNAGLF